MARRYGDGSLFKRGRVYYFQYFENGKPRQVSTCSERLDHAKQFRNEILGKVLRGDLNRAIERSPATNCLTIFYATSTKTVSRRPPKSGSWSWTLTCARSSGT